MLNDKQKRFVAEYLVDQNATQAAIRAGYSEKTAKQIGARLLTNVYVAAAVAKGQQKVAAKLEITVERIAEELAKIGFSDLRQAFDGGRLLHPGEWPDDAAAAISSVEVVTRSIGDGEVEHVHKIKLWDKRAALVDLGKHLGMFRTPGDAPDNPVHTADVTDDRRLAAVALMAARAVKADAGNGGS